MAQGTGPETIRYETPAKGVARIMLARPEARNAQNKQMTYELNDAFDRAARDDEISVIVLAADGPHFSSGHDLRDRTTMALQAAMSLQQLGHSHNAQVHGMPVDPRGLEVIRKQAKAQS